ncbi:GNAT family N-acetyltransferase [Streptomyces chrestomyceticus]|uniref:GNAT family N-acetyltransferase n=1 Tax=Streptomyces chrestomyceticus TaxID=68185 RepID=UPI00369FF07D
MEMITFRLAADTDADVAALVALYDGAARWMQGRGIDQWTPGERDAEHFRLRIKQDEVWFAEVGGEVAGAWELWWEDLPAWGPQPPVAGYLHRLMVDRDRAPAGTGRAMLARAERRIAEAGRPLSRLDCKSGNPRLRPYYESAGYRVVGEQRSKEGSDGSRYTVTLLEKRVLGPGA